jgi:hypothetical protein
VNVKWYHNRVSVDCARATISCCDDFLLRRFLHTSDFEAPRIEIRAAGQACPGFSRCLPEQRFAIPLGDEARVLLLIAAREDTEPAAELVGCGSIGKGDGLAEYG